MADFIPDDQVENDLDSPASQPVDDSYFRDNFNSALNPDEEQQFQGWLADRSTKDGRDRSLDLQDYDMRGYWANGGGREGATPDVSGHFPDTWKKPNHPTFSNQSIYDGVQLADGSIVHGGSWQGDTYQPPLPVAKTRDFIPDSEVEDDLSSGGLIESGRNILRSVDAGLGRLGSGLGHTAEYALDALGVGTPSWLQTVTDAQDSFGDKRREQVSARPGSWEKSINNFTEGTAASLPAFAAGPIGGASLLGMSSFGQTLDDNNFFDPNIDVPDKERILDAGLTSLATNAGAALLPAGQAFAPEIGLARRILSIGVAAQGGNALAAQGNELADSIAQGRDFSEAKALEQTRAGAGPAAVQAGLLAGVGHLMAARGAVVPDQTVTANDLGDVAKISAAMEQQSAPADGTALVTNLPAAPVPVDPKPIQADLIYANNERVQAKGEAERAPGLAALEANGREWIAREAPPEPAPKAPEIKLHEDAAQKSFPTPIEELKAKAEEKAKPIIAAPDPEKQLVDLPEVAEPQTVKERSRFWSERGAVDPRIFDYSGLKKVLSGKSKDISYRETPEEYRFFRDNKHVLQRAFGFPTSIAERFPKFKPIVEAGLNLFKDRHAEAFDMNQTLEPYNKLDNKKNVDKALIAARLQGDKFQATPESLAKLGLSQPEVDAFMSVRKTMDDAILKMKNEELIDAKTPADLAAVNARFAEYEGKNYVPFTRYGNKFLALRDPATNELKAYHMADSNRDLTRIATKELAENPNLKVESGDVILPFKSEKFHRASLDLLNQAGESVPNVQGFQRHLLEAKLTPGFEADMGRNISEYVSGLSNTLAHKRAERVYKQAVDGLTTVEESGLKQYAEKYWDSLTTRNPLSAKIHQFFATYYLAANFKTIAVNLTQPITTTWPILAKYSNGLKAAPERAFTKAAYKATRLLAHEGSFAKSDPHLFAAVQAARRNGVLGANIYHEITGRAHNPNSKLSRFQDVVFKFNDISEKANRYHAFMAGWEIYPDAVKKFYAKKGLPAPDRQTFAEKFVDETQFNYTKANRQPVFRGPLGSMAGIFRIWPANMIKLMKNSALERQYGVMARGLTATMLMGGAMSLPLLNQLKNAAAAAGIDTERKAREWYKGSWADNNVMSAENFLYGPLQKITGARISGALGVGDLVPGLEEGLAPGLMRGVLGVTPDLVQRVGKAYWLKNSQDSPYRAAEALMPEAVRNAMVAYRWSQKGVRDAKNRSLLNDAETGEALMPTAWEIGAKAFGFTPPRIGEGYAKTNSLDIQKKRSEENGNINFKLAKAEFEGDDNRYQQLLDENDKANESRSEAEQVEPNRTQIKKYIRSMEDADEAAKKDLPKKARGVFDQISGLYNTN